MNTMELFNHIKETLVDAIDTVAEEGVMPYIVLRSERFKHAMRLLRENDALDFNFLSSIASVDLKDSIAVVYHLFSLTKKHRIAVKVVLNRDTPEIETVTDIWPGANWHEREAYDMFGVRFSGHPDLRRLLLPEDWVGYPLRKDYTFPEEYHGISGSK